MKSVDVDVENPVMNITMDGNSVCDIWNKSFCAVLKVSDVYGGNPIMAAKCGKHFVCVIKN